MRGVMSEQMGSRGLTAVVVVMVTAQILKTCYQNAENRCLPIP